MLKSGCVWWQIEHELERLVAKSGKLLLSEVIRQYEARQQRDGLPVAAGGGGQFSSITKRFVQSVKDLSQELQGPQMQLHFIRCFIPNCHMKPDNFERKIVLQQVRAPAPRTRARTAGPFALQRPVCAIHLGLHVGVLIIAFDVSTSAIVEQCGETASTFGFDTSAIDGGSLFSP